MYAFAIISARGGSKGLPGKNIKPLADLSLFGWALKAARSSRTLLKTVVSTEDPKVARSARRLTGKDRRGLVRDERMVGRRQT